MSLRTGQSPGEFGNYSAYLAAQDTRPLGYTTYHSFTELNASGASARYIDALRRTVCAARHPPLLPLLGTEPATRAVLRASLWCVVPPIRPPCQGLFSGLAESGRWFREALGDEQHVVLPHVSLALTPGATVLPLINAGAYDGALREFADAIPRLGRPMFLRIG